MEFANIFTIFNIVTKILAVFTIAIIAYNLYYKLLCEPQQSWIVLIIIMLVCRLYFVVQGNKRSIYLSTYCDGQYCEKMSTSMLNFNKRTKFQIISNFYSYISYLYSYIHTFLLFQSEKIKSQFYSSKTLTPYGLSSEKWIHLYGQSMLTYSYLYIELVEDEANCVSGKVKGSIILVGTSCQSWALAVIFITWPLRKDRRSSKWNNPALQTNHSQLECISY